MTDQTTLKKAKRRKLSKPPDEVAAALDTLHRYNIIATEAQTSQMVSDAFKALLPAPRPILSLEEEAADRRIIENFKANMDKYHRAGNITRPGCADVVLSIMKQGFNPPKNIRWAEFCHNVRVAGEARIELYSLKQDKMVESTARGFDDKSIKRAVNWLRTNGAI